MEKVIEATQNTDNIVAQEVKENKDWRKAKTRTGRNARWLWGIALTLFSLCFIGFGSWLLYKHFTEEPRTNLVQITRDAIAEENGTELNPDSN